MTCPLLRPGPKALILPANIHGRVPVEMALLVTKSSLPSCRETVGPRSEMAAKLTCLCRVAAAKAGGLIPARTTLCPGQEGWSLTRGTCRKGSVASGAAAPRGTAPVEVEGVEIGC